MVCLWLARSVARSLARSLALDRQQSRPATREMAGRVLGCGPVCLWGNEGPSVRGRQTVSSTVIFVVDLCLNRKDVEEGRHARGAAGSVETGLLVPRALVLVSPCSLRHAARVGTSPTDGSPPYFAT